VHLLDEIEEHDHVADNNANEAGNPRNAMNPNGVPMIASAINAPIAPYGAAANTSNGLDGILELHEQGQVRCRRERLGERRRDS